MSLAYRLLYAIGFTPWEQMAHLRSRTRSPTSLPARRGAESRTTQAPVARRSLNEGRRSRQPLMRASWPAHSRSRSSNF